MRDQLIGYLIGALDEEEHSQVEETLENDDTLNLELRALRSSLDVLEGSKADFPIPPNLASRTCLRVARESAPALAERPHELSTAPGGRWALLDYLVAAGVALAAGLLLLPAINQSRFHARVLSCQDNLREVSRAIEHYSQHHNGLLPEIATSGNLSLAGSYAPMLLERQLISDTRRLLCPNSPLLDASPMVHFPTMRELREADSNQLSGYRNLLNHAYGYTLGYTQNGRYRTRHLDRSPYYAILADKPGDGEDLRSRNHGGCGQNVLFADGHIKYLNVCHLKETDGHLFLNADGRRAPGKHPDDSVIVPGDVHLDLSGE